MRKLELVIAGGSLTPARAIECYRAASVGGGRPLASVENVLPHHRPPLSKRFLRGETTDAPFAEDASFYRDNDVEVLLETAVSPVDPGNHFVKDLIAEGAPTRALHDSLVGSAVAS